MGPIPPWRLLFALLAAGSAHLSVAATTVASSGPTTAADSASRYVTEPGWRKVKVAGKEVQLYYPKNVASASALRPVIYLHGHSQSPIWGRAAFEKVADAHDFVYICPRGGFTWWTDIPHATFDPKLSAERYILDTLVPYIQTSLDPRIVVKPLAVCGISMGGQGALRLAFRHPETFPIVASIAAAIAYDRAIGKWREIGQMYGNAEAAAADTAIHHIDSARRPWKILMLIDPADSEWIDGNVEFEKALTAKGIAHERDFKTTGGGHGWGYFDRMAPKMGGFLAKSFEDVLPSAKGARLVSFDVTDTRRPAPSNTAGARQMDAPTSGAWRAASRISHEMTIGNATDPSDRSDPSDSVAHTPPRRTNASLTNDITTSTHTLPPDPYRGDAQEGE